MIREGEGTRRPCLSHRHAQREVRKHWAIRKRGERWGPGVFRAESVEIAAVRRPGCFLIALARFLNSLCTIPGVA
jgi:hypothetical protein